VGRLGPGMLVSASVQIIPRPVCRLGLGLGSGLRVGAGVTSRGIFGRGGCLREELSPGGGGLSPRIVIFMPSAKLWAAEAIMFSICPAVVVYVPTPRADISILSLCANTERISVKFGGGNHYQLMNLLHFG